jgi:hypothetical protein
VFDVASASALFTSLVTDVGTVVYTVFTTLIPIVAGLLGLGFGIRHVKRWITGKKA